MTEMTEIRRPTKGQRRSKSATSVDMDESQTSVAESPRTQRLASLVAGEEDVSVEESSLEASTVTEMAVTTTMRSGDEEGDESVRAPEWKSESLC